MRLLTVAWLAVVATLSVLGFVHAAPKTGYTFKVKESVVPPRGWTKHSPAPKDMNIELRIALPQENFPLLEQHLLEISDPAHDRYGEHLSAAEVFELVAPPQDSAQQVTEWLASYGLHEEDLSFSPGHDWIKVRIPIGAAEELLDTEYFVWTREDGASVVRTTGYSLPAHLHAHIELIQPTTLFSLARGMRRIVHAEAMKVATIAADAPPLQVPTASGGQVNASCAEIITVGCLLQLYNAVGYQASAKIGNQIAVTGYGEEFANLQDLQLFYQAQRPDAVNSSFQLVSVNGGVNNQSAAEAGMEADLDTQFAFGISHPIPATFYTTGGVGEFIPDELTPTNTNEPYLDWIDYVLAHPNPPQTISTSYGDDEQTVPESYARRVCNGFAQLGARGITLLFSSGDGGVGDGDPDPLTQECITNNGLNETRFNPIFPATCPFVTAVGGTAGIPEVANSLSGGGFSNYFSRPDYQSVSVNKFLNELGGTYAGLFNSSGRGYPDISAQSNSFNIIFSGFSDFVGGTSASTPAAAGFVALLNDARLKQGLPPLGFLNPLIYSLGAQDSSGLNDIVEGNNPGCGTPGFSATEGWDPVTGFGTPNFGKLRDIVTQH